MTRRSSTAALRWLGIERAQHRDYHWNDTGNADRLADLFGHELVYCTERKNYYVWTGQRWQFDEFVEAEKRAEKTMLEAFAEAKHITDAEKRKAFLRFVNQLAVSCRVGEHDSSREEESSAGQRERF